MAKKLTKTARIRKLLEQGKSVKQITAMVHCSPQQVYQIRAADKKKVVKVIQKRERDAIRYGVDKVLVPKDYFQPKPTLWERFKSFIGA